MTEKRRLPQLVKRCPALYILQIVTLTAVSFVYK